MNTRTDGSAGVLVVGMHRSGTSMLSRLLDLAGADIGHRVTGAGAGNERGHWEDAFAVETHERLLAAFGARWSDPFCLPGDWRTSDAAARARDAIARYLRDDRARHRAWVVKDPRLCLFADLWIDAAEQAGLPLSIALIARHPLQVAHSLQVRDGLGLSAGQLLWLDCSAGAIAAAARVPSCVLRHDDLIPGWREAVRSVARLPGMQVLSEPGVSQVEAFLEPALRHHQDVSGPLPRVVEALWRQFDQPDPEARAAAAEALVSPVRELLQPLLQDARADRRTLWERAATAEALLTPGSGALMRLPDTLGELRVLAQEHHAQVTDAISVEIRAMQRAQREAMEGAAASQRAEAQARQSALEVQAQAQQAALEAEARAQQAALEADAREAATRQAMQDALDQAIEKALHNAAARELAVREEAERIALEQVGLRTGLANQLEDAEARADALRVECDALQALVAGRDGEIERLRSHQAAMLAEQDRLHAVERQFDLLRTSRSWRLTKPLRVAMRLARGQWTPADSARASASVLHRPWLARALPRGLRARLERAAAGNAILLAPALPAALPPPLAAPATDGIPDVFVWSVIDWHFRTQRPQHLARALAEKGHRVFYVSNNFIPGPAPGFRVQPLDAEGRLFQVQLALDPAVSIYAGMPDAAQVDALLASLARLLEWSQTRQGLSFVQHPFWSRLARSVPNARIVYDCMDHHSGFENNAGSIIAAESELARAADLVVVTSEWLREEMQDKSRRVALVRNATEYGFFSRRPDSVFRDPQGRRVIGYYGAIAEWFDVELVRQVALAQPEALVLLVGADTAGAGRSLADLPNVHMTGEVPYAELPHWLYGFDACLLPFKVIPLTLATNPVKVYEYLSAGKPVVSVDLPEMRQFDGLVATAGDAAEFVSAVAAALDEDAPGLAARRQAFAAGQTWAHRAAALDDAVAAIEEPRVSVIVLAYNNLAYTQACLFSIEAYSDYPALEVVVVDNASTDGSPEWLAAWEQEGSAAGHRRRLILNTDNAGFAAGNNIGLAAASGEVLVVLNNDTYATPGWVRTLCAHLQADPTLGLVGPVTNNIGNEARIEIQYPDMPGMIAAAGAWTRRHPGGETPLETAAFFCVAMPRAVYEAVGGLDEAFGLGFFEDDDYCRRVAAAGYRIACAEDVFVHHHLSASFDAIGADRKRALFERNKAIYEAKWGPWTPHGYREAGR